MYLVTPQAYHYCYSKQLEVFMISEFISKKTDENEVNCEHKTAIYLEHCIPIDDQSFINNVGCINKAKLQNFINVLGNKIVGWYSFRRNSSLAQCSLNELLIHQSLLELLPDVKSQYFVACLMTSTSASNMATHTFNHVFMTYDPYQTKFENLRLKIYTLSDKSVNNNGYVSKSLFPMAESFNDIVSHMQEEETPVKSVLEIHKKVKNLLKDFDQKLQNIDNYKLQLEKEVEVLKRKLAIKKQKNLIENLGSEVSENEELKVKTIKYNPDVKYKNVRKSVFIQPTVHSPVQNEKIIKKWTDCYYKNECLKNSPLKSDSDNSMRKNMEHSLPSETPKKNNTANHISSEEENNSIVQDNNKSKETDLNEAQKK
ncbi:conserved hypothetical protein [Pediculus humanus corporis]|uniref:Uncharacterized protein n=1 Tax=Pediculus humanus subsp. corporis TaxID=121224 RepID=E0VV81_PEDHC|nr:uncharacterized protein Phum_PHUM459480 [Pediculus humanus corporis]EEB17287.1 conserved hypothetical protein [Pediculus humanus corporis]